MNQYGINNRFSAQNRQYGLGSGHRGGALPPRRKIRLSVAVVRHGRGRSLRRCPVERRASLWGHLLEREKTEETWNCWKMDWNILKCLSNPNFDTRLTYLWKLNMNPINTFIMIYKFKKSSQSNQHHVLEFPFFSFQSSLDVLPLFCIVTVTNDDLRPGQMSIGERVVHQNWLEQLIWIPRWGYEVFRFPNFAFKWLEISVAGCTSKFHLVGLSKHDD